MLHIGNYYRRIAGGRAVPSAANQRSGLVYPPSIDKLTMKPIHAVLTSIVLSLAFAASAAETLYVGGNGGSVQKAFEQNIIPSFEAKTGAKVVYVPGNSTDILAKLVAQKGKQDMSLALIDDGPMQQAMEQGLCAPMELSGPIKDLYPNAYMAGGKAVGFGFYATGLGYNTAVFAKNGWKAPTSWMDLADPKFKGKVSIGSIPSYGMLALVMMARANGGSETNIEPGFDVMSKKVAPNVLAWESSPANMAQMLQSGEAALVAWGNLRVQAVADQGAPVAFVFPKEGAMLGMYAACVISGAPQPKLARLFMEETVQPASQVLLAKAAGIGPTNRNTKLEPDLAKKVVYGADQANALIPIDWSTINLRRAEWTKRWNREVER